MQGLQPEPQVVGVGGIIRWAVGDQDDPNWRRSRTWNLVGSPNSDDVYLVPRQEMGIVKLSLHGTWWRLALNESAAKGPPEGRDRLLPKWAPTPQRWPGWRLAVTVRVPHSSLRSGWSEPTAKPRPVEFVLPPHPGHELSFDLLLGARDGAELVVSGASDIGRMALPSGGLLAVVVHEVALDDAEEERLAEQRRIMWPAIRRATPRPPGVSGGRGHQRWTEHGRVDQREGDTWVGVCRSGRRSQTPRCRSGRSSSAAS